MAKSTFGDDLNFLKQYHKDLIVLGNDHSGAAVIILPAYQGRVMTSTTDSKKALHLHSTTGSRQRHSIQSHLT